MSILFSQLNTAVPELACEKLSSVESTWKDGINGYFLAETCCGEDNPATHMSSGDVLIFSGMYLTFYSRKIKDIFRVGHDRQISGAVIFDVGYSQSLLTDVAIASHEYKIPVLIFRNRKNMPALSSNDFVTALFTQLRRSKRKSQDKLFEAVLGGTIKDEAELKRRYGYDTYPFEWINAVISIRIETGGAFLPKNKIEETCKRQLLANNIPFFITGFVGDEFFALVCNKDENIPVEEIAKSLDYTVHQELEKIIVYCGISEPFSGYESFADAIRTADLCSRAMRAMKWSSVVKYPSEIKPYTHLLQIKDQKGLAELSGARLEPLFYNMRIKGRRSDYGSTDDLIRTLEYYLANGCNKSATAEKLFIHRNTLQMRLDRIEKICNIDLSANDDLFELQFELVVNRLLMRG